MPIDTAGFPASPAHLTSAAPTGPNASRDFVLDQFDITTIDDVHEAVRHRYSRVLGTSRQVNRPRRERLRRAAALLLDGLTERNVPFNRATERDWRLVLYDWMPLHRHVPAHGAPRILRRLPPFIKHLALREGVEYPWVAGLLDDVTTFQARCGSFPRGDDVLDPDVVAWRRLLFDDLWDRALLPHRAMTTGGRWLYECEPEPGDLDDLSETAWDLFEELMGRWLVWREDVLETGLTEVERVRGVLIARQREWEQTPEARYGGLAPMAVLEKARRGER